MSELLYSEPVNLVADHTQDREAQVAVVDLLFGCDHPGGAAELIQQDGEMVAITAHLAEQVFDVATFRNNARV